MRHLLGAVQLAVGDCFLRRGVRRDFEPGQPMAKGQQILEDSEGVGAGHICLAEQ